MTGKIDYRCESYAVYLSDLCRTLLKYKQWDQILSINNDHLLIYLPVGHGIVSSGQCPYFYMVIFKKLIVYCIV